MESKKRCLYHKLENGIREFIFTESSNAAIDEWIEWLDYTLEEDPVPEGGTDRVLFNTLQSGSLPMYYSFKRLKQWQQQHPGSDQNRYGRAAQLYNANSFYVTMAQNFMKIFSFTNSKMEYFFNDREAAIAWLLRDD